MEANLYRSILQNLSQIPEEYMTQVNTFLSSLRNKTQHKDHNREEILNLAGAWSDMSESDFKEYLKTAKESGKSLWV